MVNRGDDESPKGGLREAAALAMPDNANLLTVLLFDPATISSIADALPVMVAYCDAELIYRFCNQPICDWFERPREAILGRSAREIMGEAAFATRKDALALALKGEKQWFAARFDHPTRGPLTTQAEYTPHVAEDGTIAGVIMVVQDLTEQRAAEVALRESEARFRRIANSAPAPMWVTRADGSRDFVNEAFVDFFGFAETDVREKDWHDAVHLDDREAMVERYAAGIASGEAFEATGRLRRADGEWRWMRSLSKPRKDGDGRTIGFIGFAHDVTLAKEAELELRRLVDQRTAELAQAQDQLRQSQKMEALGQLTGGIAHDFNNLLTVVVGGLDLIARDLTDARMLRYARNALAAAERGARLTGQLLAFSRVQRLEVKPTSIAPLIDDMRPILRNVLGPGIEQRFLLDEELVPVMADPTQVEVALLNLAINARDAMPDGGALSIGTRIVEIGADDPELEPGTYVELSIGDTGVGMSADVASRAFEPFFTTKEVGKGTGLGLSMVYGMARQSGGTARIESAPGTGTTVQLYFRRADVKADDGAGTGTDPEKLTLALDREISVLVIDDDPDVREFVAASLDESPGFSVRSAADGKAGLIAFADEAPDVIVLDYVMPGMTGAEVGAKILAERPDQPILFVSGYSETDAIRAIAPDAPILAKPFRPETLIEAIRALAVAKV